MVEHAEPSPALEIFLFGSFAVRVEGHPMPRLRTRKGQSLLGLLALRQGREIEREWLAATLWPESSEQRAYANLRLSLVDLRRALGAQSHRLHAPSPRVLCLDTAGTSVDVLLFDHAVARGDAVSLERATALYRGPLLESCLEEWVLAEREVRGQAYLRALESLAAGATERGDSATAAHYLRRAIAMDPLRETAQRALMQALAQNGSYAAAVLAYRWFRTRLRREMAAEPDPQTRVVFEQLRADARNRARITPKSNGLQDKRLPSPASQTITGSPMSTPAASESAHRRNNLPHPRTSFIGRHQEIEEISRLLRGGDPAPRLLTLTGAGGSGKTRLALRAGAALDGDYPDGVWLVELAPLSDPSLLPQAIAAVLGVSERAGTPLQETVEAHLRPRSLLLLLDNCEHLLEGCAELADRLLRHCPRLRILATSREILRVGGEFVYRVPSLTLPESLEVLPVECVHKYEAVHLFTDRAVFSHPSFALTVGNLPAVVEICRRLDGSPLAIELAAARTGALAVEQLSQRLGDCFNLLTGGSRAALPRQQTLRATIDWSYDLLDESERLLLRRLSVFAGGCTLESVEAICAETGNKTTVLDRLSNLVNKSLVVAEVETSGGGMRYRLLETVRQYARERLVETGEAPSTRERHAKWFLRLAGEAEAALWDEDGPTWTARLEAEHDNLRAALEYSRDLGDGCETGMRLAGTLAQFWYMGGYWTEGREWVEGTLRRGHQQTSAGHAKALFGAGILAWIQDDYRKARQLLERSLLLWRELADDEGYFVTVLVLGSVLGTVGEYAIANEMLAESLAFFLRTDARTSAVFCLAYLSRNAFEQEDYATAQTMSEQCLTLSRENEHRWGQSFAMMIMASVAGKKKDYEHAVALCHESLALSREIGNRRGLARGELLLGLIACRREQFAEAARHLQECRRFFQDLGDQEGICYTLEGMALLCALSSQPERAVRLLAAAQGLRNVIGVSLPPSSRTMKESWLGHARSRLGEDAFSRTWHESFHSPPTQITAMASEEVFKPREP
ncbi:MAG: hypothetical protein H8F28_00155 [Fibrella sp.]|nr:hypothetical protein [Armatimonadota bacterium]